MPERSAQNTIPIQMLDSRRLARLNLYLAVTGDVSLPRGHIDKKRVTLLNSIQDYNSPVAGMSATGAEGGSVCTHLLRATASSGSTMPNKLGSYLLPLANVSDI